MKLYHFCGEKFLPSILKNGISEGRTPIIKTCVDDPDSFELIGWHIRTQWLTINPDPQKQSWATRESISYSRTDYRLTVWVSVASIHKVLTPAQAIKAMKVAPMLFEKFSGSEDWRIYRGVIRPESITAVEDLRRKQVQQ